jgi:hypothetical protein
MMVLCELAIASAAARNIPVDRFVLFPVIGKDVLWSCVYAALACPHSCSAWDKIHPARFFNSPCSHAHSQIEPRFAAPVDTFSRPPNVHLKPSISRAVQQPFATLVDF